MRCLRCGECHVGACDNDAVLAWQIDCVLDAIDEVLDLPPEPGSKRWLIARGELVPEILVRQD